jgi:hypothetical protein
MAGFGVGTLAGLCLFDSASPTNLAGMALGLGLVYFVQRRGAARRLPRDRRHDGRIR